jgi:hypothetical protein
MIISKIISTMYGNHIGVDMDYSSKVVTIKKITSFFLVGPGGLAHFLIGGMAILQLG